jgi:hypothetical protein
VNAGRAAAVAFMDPPLDEAPVAVAAAEDAGATIETGLRAAFDAAATLAWADEDAAEAAEAGGRGCGGCGCA